MTKYFITKFFSRKNVDGQIFDHKILKSQNFDNKTFLITKYFKSVLFLKI